MATTRSASTGGTIVWCGRRDARWPPTMRAPHPGPQPGSPTQYRTRGWRNDRTCAEFRPNFSASASDETVRGPLPEDPRGSTDKPTAAGPSGRRLSTSPGYRRSSFLIIGQGTVEFTAVSMEGSNTFLVEDLLRYLLVQPADQDHRPPEVHGHPYLFGPAAPHHCFLER